jgi:hypothetical protein
LLNLSALPLVLFTLATTLLWRRRTLRGALSVTVHP